METNNTIELLDCEGNLLTIDLNDPHDIAAGLHIIICSLQPDLSPIVLQMLACLIQKTEQQTAINEQRRVIQTLCNN